MYICTLSNMAGSRSHTTDLSVQPTNPPSSPCINYRAVLKSRQSESSITALKTRPNTAPCRQRLSDSRLDMSEKKDFRSVLAKQREHSNSSQRYLDKSTGGRLIQFDVEKPSCSASQIDFRSVLNRKAIKTPDSRSEVDNNTVFEDSVKRGNYSHFNVNAKSTSKGQSSATSSSNGISPSLESSIPQCPVTDQSRRSGQNSALFIKEQYSTSDKVLTSSISGQNVALDSKLYKSHRNSVSSNTSDDSGIEQGEYKSVTFKRVHTMKSPVEKSKEATTAITKTTERLGVPVNSESAPVDQDGIAQKPRFLSKPPDQTVQEGAQASIEVKVIANPEPSILWTLNKKEVKPSKYFQISYENNTARLMITETYAEYDGEYTCTATNTAGSTSCSCDLFVEENSLQSSEHTDEECPLEAPRVLDISPTNLAVKKGGVARIQATFTTESRPRVKWQQNRTDIIPDERFHIGKQEHSSTLEIHNVRPRDSGRYHFVAENDLGLDKATVSIQVEDVPNPPVGKPFADDVTQTSITLSWYGPAFDGGSPVTCYVVEMRQADDGTNWKTITVHCENTSYHVTNIDPETAYIFRVSAENKHGVSQPSLTSEVVETASRRLSMRLNSMESDDELPFEPRHVTMSSERRFEDSYKLLDELGKGKFGSVYQCLETSTGSRYAVKMIKCREKEKVDVRKEVDIMNHLSHPKLLMLRDAYEAPNTVILITEFVGGGELFERVVDDNFELTELDCVHFMRQICDGVGYMHNKFIIHLDLKPENILCVRPGSNLIKIIDFGLARFHQPGESAKVLFGTPEFIAPEVVNYDGIGFATDGWSLGVICYVLLSGLSPFLGDTDAETLSNVTRGDFDFDDETFDDISDDAKDFIEKLLVKNPKKRMQIEACHQHTWLTQTTSRLQCKRLSTGNLKRFMARRKWQVEEEVETFSHSPIPVSGADRAKSRRTQTAEVLNGTSESSRKLPLDSLSVNVESRRVRNHNKNDSVVKDCPTSLQNRSSRIIHKDSAKITATSPIPDSSLPSREKTSLLRKEESSSHLKRDSNLKSNFRHRDSVPSRPSSSRVLRRSAQEFSSPALPVGSPIFVKKMLDMKACLCDAARFDVRLSGEPEPRLLWYHEGDVIHEDQRHMFTLAKNGDCSLILKYVTEDDEGEYTCRAFNRHGDASCSAELIICRTDAFGNRCVK